MLRHLVPSFLFLLLTACSTTHPNASPSPRESSSGQAYASGERLDSVTQRLLGYAASDFRAHSAVAQVRNVRLGHVLTAKGQKQHLVCGEFLPAHSEGGQREWTTFATIETHPYEQWLGGQAESWCKHSKVNWEKNVGDLSAALRSRLGSLK
jgi:hypothetical protein